MTINQGLKTIIYPVKDLAAAKVFFSRLLDVEPYADTAYYVGFKIGDQEIGLDPNGHKEGMTAYYHVNDINKGLQSLLDAGATVQQKVKDVGGGRLIAKVYCSMGAFLLNEELLRANLADILSQFCDVSEFAGEPWAKKYACPSSI